MKWEEEETVQVPTTVEKTVPVECRLVVHRKRKGLYSYEAGDHHEYVPATEDDLRRAANALGFALVGHVGQAQQKDPRE